MRGGRMIVNPVRYGSGSTKQAEVTFAHRQGTTFSAKYSKNQEYVKFSKSYTENQVTDLVDVGTIILSDSNTTVTVQSGGKLTKIATNQYFLSANA